MKFLPSPLHEGGGEACQERESGETLLRRKEGRGGRKGGSCFVGGASKTSPPPLALSPFPYPEKGGGGEEHDPKVKSFLPAMEEEEM